ncbi:MAG: FAD-dependent oxidoreductase [Opitutaceae bacterium]|nr:FAD-dependent oxidoreductase [Opitutaceae bacterium]
MLIAPPTPAADRALRHETITADFAVLGGGLSGLCAAIAAAREGLRVILVQDRPVLGGNSSSEVRLWTLGATAHMANNNRWAREGGIIDEIVMENLWRNPEGNTLLWDALLLEKVRAEPTLTLLLNTAVHSLAMDPAEPSRIASVEAFCPQNSTRYTVSAPWFCDATGDGIVGFLAGAAFRMGAEAREEFDEKFAPDDQYGKLLGHSLYFYTKDTGRPVTYVPPAFALMDITQIPRWRGFNVRDHGCKLWWIEYGGRLDTIHDTETIKWELWKVVYGVWHHIKNSGLFPEAANLTLEWIGTIPGKRESRRFEGDYLLQQRDLIEQREHPDVVSYGGWSIDLHPADGIYSPRKGCDQWHSRGVYQIPYRCLYSRNVDNLFLAGRLISVTHVAFGSTRVMGTGAHGGQAVGIAAAHLHRAGLRSARELLAPERLAALQTALLRRGQHLPRRARLADAADLARSATLSCSSEYMLHALPDDGPALPLRFSSAQMLPLGAGPAPSVTLTVDVSAPTDLVVELRTSDHPENHTPDVLLASRILRLSPGNGQPVALDFSDVVIDRPRYVFLCLLQNEAVSVHTTTTRVTGLLSVRKAVNPAISKFGEQIPPADRDIGVERFEFWPPERRPGGHNFALRLDPPLRAWPLEALRDGVARPTDRPHAWAAATDDAAPSLTLHWPAPVTVSRVWLTFDADYDHPAESSLWGHPERAAPFRVRSWSLHDATGRELARETDGHVSRVEITLPTPATTDRLELRLGPAHGNAPAALFDISVLAG